MAQKQLPPNITRYGEIVSPSGLIVPQSYDKSAFARAIVAVQENSIPENGFNGGVLFPRDSNTMAVRFALKGSGRDDRMSEAIVDGNVANIGLAPVVSAQISAAVRRQGNQAMNSTIDISGRETPFKQARNAIAAFDDNPLGVTAALELMCYRLNTYNRGSPISTVPIMYEFDTWEQYGMIAHPITVDGREDTETDKYWLEVDWSRFGTPVPFLPDPLDLEATGDKEYPYWYNATLQDGKRVWVLLHKTHCIPVVPGVSGTEMIGTCPAWMCLGWLAENILTIDERAEKMLYTLADGIYMLGGAEGIDPERDVLKKLEANRQLQYERGFKVAKTPAIIAAPVDKVSIAHMTLRQPPGVEFKDWREYCEDVTAFVFGETLSAMVVRGGVGYGAQADAATENTMDSAIGAHLARIGNALGSIYPRVLITCTRANDRAARLNIRTMAQFSNAAVALINAQVWSAQEARTVLDRDIVTIPEADDLTASANASDEVDDGEDGGDSDDGGSEENAGGAAAEPENERTEQSIYQSVQFWSMVYRLHQHTGISVADLLTQPHEILMQADLQLQMLQAGQSARESAQDWQEVARNTQPPMGLRADEQTTQEDAFTFAKAPRFFGDVLAVVEDVVITDADVDRAIAASKRRVDQTLHDLLTAEPVLE